MKQPKNNNKNTLFFVLLLICTLLMLVVAGWKAAIGIIILFYFLHTLFLSDHIYYSTKMDYQFTLANATKIPFELKNGCIIFSEGTFNSFDTCFLPLHIQSTWQGKLIDPYIEIMVDGIGRKQFFERGTDGVRYINLSPYLTSLAQNKNQLAIKFIACEGKADNQQAIAFNNTQLHNKSVLIISPHADDAELAAFGFYKHQKNVSIATITAGESEADQYLSLANNKAEAGILKGRLRAWDSVAVPKWANKNIKAINLGYACSSLKDMFLSQANAIESKATGETNTELYRQFNDCTLPTSANPINQWSNLIQDLVFLLERDKPEIIITPHPRLDSHSDHQYSTRAIVEACDQLQLSPTFLCYANHYQTTDQYPFGSEHTDLPLPPHFYATNIADSLYSFELSTADQIDKVCALQMMHDLQRPIKLKKKMRIYLQQFIGRSSYPYGQDEYFRKAIRNQEIFWVMRIDGLQAGSPQNR